MLKKLQEKFTKAMADAEAIRQKYNGKPEDMTGDDLEAWEKATADAEKYQRQIENHLKSDRLDKWAKEAGDDHPVPGDNAEEDLESEDDEDDHKTARSGGRKVKKYTSAQLAHQKAWRKLMVSGSTKGLSDVELKTMQADSPTGGGYLIAPEQFVEELLVGVKDECFMRQISRDFPLTQAASLGVPTLATDVGDADWTGELTAANTDEITFGKRALHPKVTKKLVKISKNLLRLAAMNPEGIVRDRLAYKYAITEEKAFLTGDGDNKPLGVFTASADGISAARDTTSATGGDFKGDDVIDTFHSMKTQYWNKGVWLLHRLVLAHFRKLKDSNNNYIWQPFAFPGQMLTGSNPGLILGRPYYTSEYAPSAITSGNYVAIFGDFSNYWIATVMSMTVQVLEELYAITGQNGYLSEMWVDGAPQLEEAFARLKVQ
jgi:HK97 family phage major capsid protein